MYTILKYSKINGPPSHQSLHWSKIVLLLRFVGFISELHCTFHLYLGRTTFHVFIWWVDASPARSVASTKSVMCLFDLLRWLQSARLPSGHGVEQLFLEAAPSLPAGAVAVLRPVDAAAAARHVVCSPRETAPVVSPATSSDGIPTLA